MIRSFRGKHPVVPASAYVDESAQLQQLAELARVLHLDARIPLAVRKVHAFDDTRR